MSRYGRYQVAEPLHSLAVLHTHQGQTLHEVDHEPKVAVLDQSDLLAQGIRTSQLIPGCPQDVDGLGSCTANANTSALSNVLTADQWQAAVGSGYDDTVAAEKFAIAFYHRCTDQTGDPSTEWPPTDCGSSGPYIIQADAALGLAQLGAIAHGGQNLVSLMQTAGVLMGSPWLNVWEEPTPDGFIDGGGTAAELEEAIAYGVAGGHETFLSAVEKLTVDQTGRVDPFNTVLRIRNSWGPTWGGHGSCRIHLATLEMLGQYCDFRTLAPLTSDG